MDRLSTQINPKKPANIEQQMVLDDIARLSGEMASLNNPAPELLKDLWQMIRSCQQALIGIERDIAVNNFYQRD